eukprot:CFRG4435T1
MSGVPPPTVTIPTPEELAAKIQARRVRAKLSSNKFIRSSTASTATHTARSSTNTNTNENSNATSVSSVNTITHPQTIVSPYISVPSSVPVQTVDVGGSASLSNSSIATSANVSTSIVREAITTNAPVQVKNVNPNSITINQRQKGNPILKHIRNIAYEYGDCLPDYHINPNVAIMYLSMRFHLYRSNYIGAAVRSLGRTYPLRVLLVHLDVDQYHNALIDLTKLSTLNGLTLLVASSAEECARYIETYKRYENKNADMLMERMDETYLSRSTGFLTDIPSVNSTDVVTLLSNFGTLKAVCSADTKELAELPGFGEQKVHRIFDAFRAPFVPSRVPEEAITHPKAIGPNSSENA